MTITKEEQKRLKSLFKNYDKLIGTKKALTDFKEPVILLMRRDNTVEFYEGAKGNEFEFVHSDGKDRSILIGTVPPHKFDYASRSFRGYIAHEDFPTPLPSNPILTTELVSLLIEKTLSDFRKWKAEEWKGRGKFIMYIALGVGAIILAYTIFRMFSPEPVKQAAQQTATVLYNATQTAVNNAPTIIK